MFALTISLMNERSSQKTADMFAFTKEILNAKLHFLSNNFPSIQFKPLSARFTKWSNTLKQLFECV